MEVDLVVLVPGREPQRQPDGGERGERERGCGTGEVRTDTEVYSQPEAEMVGMPAGKTIDDEVAAWRYWSNAFVEPRIRAPRRAALVPSDRCVAELRLDPVVNAVRVLDGNPSTV